MKIHKQSLIKLGVMAALALPFASASFAADSGAMSNITPANFQSFAADSDTYTIDHGVVTHVPVIASTPADGPRSMDAITPAGMQSFATYQDVYARNNGVESVTLPGSLPPQVAGGGVRSGNALARYQPMRTMMRTPAPMAEMIAPQDDGPDSLKGQ
jgi:hypothetical protein